MALQTELVVSARIQLEETLLREPDIRYARETPVSLKMVVKMLLNHLVTYSAMAEIVILSKN